MHFLLAIVFALHVQTTPVDADRVSRLKQDYSQHSAILLEKTKCLTAQGTRSRDGRPTVHFTYVVDNKRSCISFKNTEAKDGEHFGIVSVYAPEYFFRLVKNTEESPYYIDAIQLHEETRTTDSQAKLEFHKVLDMGMFLYAPTDAFDVPVSKIISEDSWRIESIQGTVGESDKGNPPPAVTVTGRSTLAEGNYDTIQVALSPENHYALTSYVIRHKLDNGYQSVVTGTVSYSEQGATPQLEKVSVNTHNEGNGEIIDSNRVAVFDSFSNDCDEAVFTLSKYGLPDSLLKKATNNRKWYLLTAVLTGLACAFIIMRRFRGNST